MKDISKDYYREMQHLAVFDWLTSEDDNNRSLAREQMAYFEGRALQDYGAEFVKELEEIRLKDTKE